MGVIRITSDAARAYATRERVIGKGIIILGKASEKISELDKETIEKCGDVAAELVSCAPGYSGRLMHITARLFWNLAGVEEKKAAYRTIEELDKKLEAIEKTL